MMTAILWSIGWMLIALVLPVIDALTDPQEFFGRWL